VSQRADVAETEPTREGGDERVIDKFERKSANLVEQGAHKKVQPRVAERPDAAPRSHGRLALKMGLGETRGALETICACGASILSTIGDKAGTACPT
jgi:hypothetical protein